MTESVWDYPRPPRVEPLRGRARVELAFYPGRVDACSIGDERVTAQKGDFYGSWTTSHIRGPFKGAPDTAGW